MVAGEFLWFFINVNGLFTGLTADTGIVRPVYESQLAVNLAPEHFNKTSFRFTGDYRLSGSKTTSVMNSSLLIRQTIGFTYYHDSLLIKNADEFNFRFEAARNSGPVERTFSMSFTAPLLPPVVRKQYAPLSTSDNDTYGFLIPADGIFTAGLGVKVFSEIKLSAGLSAVRFLLRKDDPNMPSPYALPFKMAADYYGYLEAGMTFQVSGIWSVSERIKLFPRLCIFIPGGDAAEVSYDMQSRIAYKSSKRLSFNYEIFYKSEGSQDRSPGLRHLMLVAFTI